MVIIMWIIDCEQTAEGLYVMFHKLEIEYLNKNYEKTSFGISTFEPDIMKIGEFFHKFENIVCVMVCFKIDSHHTVEE